MGSPSGSSLVSLIPTHSLILFQQLNIQFLKNFEISSQNIAPFKLKHLFSGLRSKCYSILTGAGKQKSTAAGVKECVKEKELNHELYREILQGPSLISRADRRLEDYHINQVTFRSQNHTVYTIDQCKVGLTRYDDKRWILQDGVTTRPHGHYLNYRN